MYDCAGDEGMADDEGDEDSAVTEDDDDDAGDKEDRGMFFTGGFNGAAQTLAACRTRIARFSSLLDLMATKKPKSSTKNARKGKIF